MKLKTHPTSMQNLNKKDMFMEIKQTIECYWEIAFNNRNNYEEITKALGQSSVRGPYLQNHSQE
jgi:hypothetical protein